MDNKHILVSLGDDKVKQIGEVIGNKTCNKILDLLSVEEMTVTDISQKLKIHLNTIDYNIKKLVKSGLIKKNSHFWSVKGKKMPAYKISNMKIIISPRKTIGKTFAWVLGLTGLSALTIRKFMKKSFEQVRPVMLKSVQNDFVIEEADAAFFAVSSTGFWSGLNPWTWFLFGAWFAILLFFVLTIRRNK